MIIIEINKGESIEQATKRYRNKSRKVKLLQQIKERKHYTKPSIKRRDVILKAQYKQKLQESSNS